MKAYVAENLGDDLFLKILFERYPNVHFRLMYSKVFPKFVDKFSNVELVRLPEIPIILKLPFKILSFIYSKPRSDYFLKIQKKFFKTQSEKNDLFLHIGGSIFMQMDKEIPEDTACNELIVEAFNNKPKCVIGSNFGPFVTNEFLERHRKLFGKISDICFRDKKSFELFSEMKNIRYGNDIVFSLSLPKSEQIPGSVGFSLMDFSTLPNLKPYVDQYFSNLSKVIIQLVRNNRKVALFSFCQKDGDVNAIRKLAKMLPENIAREVSKIIYKGNIEEFLEKFLEMESIVATRFHSMIISILGRQFVYPMVYSEKMINVLEDLKFNGSFSKIEELDNESAEKILHALNNYKHQLDSEINSAQEHFKFLDAELKESFG